MKVIANKLWTEPSAFIGFSTSVLLVVLQIVTNNDWSTENIIAILAPFLSSLGIRQLVTPAAPKGVRSPAEKQP